MSNNQNNHPSPFSPIPNAGYGCDYSSDYTQATLKDNECLVYYEENRDRCRDERDRIQKKTFTKWVNKHLQKTDRSLQDLFTDLSDGHNLIALLEVLTSEKLIKFVNIRPEDILEGNPKLTLGLIWTIILNYQVSIIKTRQKELRCLEALAATNAASPHSAIFANPNNNFGNSQKATRKHEVNGQTVSDDNYQTQQQIGNGNEARDGLGSRGVGGGGGFQQQPHYPSPGPPPLSTSNALYRDTQFSRNEDSTYHGGSHYRPLDGRYPPPDITTTYGTPTGGNYSVNRTYDTAHSTNLGQGFSESSSYETREHYERKVQRVKKTRGERERNSFRSKNKFAIKNVSEVLANSDNVSARDALLQWARKTTAGYPGVNVTNFTSSWKDGLAFNAILHRYRPNLINWNGISEKDVNARVRLDNAFNAADQEFGVSKLLDAEDVDCDNPDEKSVITYVSSLYNALPHLDELSRYVNAMENYIAKGYEFRKWVLDATHLMDDRHSQLSYPQLMDLLSDLTKFTEEDLPLKAATKASLTNQYHDLVETLGKTNHFNIPDDVSAHALDEVWDRLLRAMVLRTTELNQAAGVEDDLNDLISRLSRGIGITNEQLDLLLARIEDVDSRADSIQAVEADRLIRDIINELENLKHPIDGFYEDVDTLKNHDHPEADDFYKQVYGLHQRREAYLNRIGGETLSRLNSRTETLRRETSQRLQQQRESVFSKVEECIEWVRVRMDGLDNMNFKQELGALDELFENHKLDNRDIQDFRQDVDECISHQAKVSAEDSEEYCHLLRTLESEYQQLRDLSAGRMLDLDSLIAFLRAAQLEVQWIGEREDIEVSRNWSDINQLDTPMLQNYYKQLLHEIELREKQFNDIHNQGAALINQRHPAVELIDSYLRLMQEQWDWLLQLASCYEVHLRDALNLKTFNEDADKVEEWMKVQSDVLERSYLHSDFSLDEGEKYLAELNEMKDMINKYQSLLMALTEKASQISPLWQRGQKMEKRIYVTANCDYVRKEITIRAGDEVTLVSNSDMIWWDVIGVDGVHARVPSVVFRIPPPDGRLTSYLQRLHAFIERLRKLWEKKHRLVRYNMILNTMRTVREWSLEDFMAIDPDQRDAIIKALNEDAMKLLSEMDPSDPLAMRLKEELRLVNEHFYNLLNQSQRPPEPDYSNQFDDSFNELARKLEEAWKKLSERVKEPVASKMSTLEQHVNDHKAFEDFLQSLDTEVSNVKELFRQIVNPTPNQRVNNDFLSERWENLWDLSKMYVDRLKALELVLNGMGEVDDMVKQHELTLASFDDLPADHAKLRGAQSQLVQLSMRLQQERGVVDNLNRNIVVLRQHAARTRFNDPKHPDVDRLDEQVQKLTVRWENVNSQVEERVRAVESLLQVEMTYRSEYDTEISWLDRVEGTINKLRRPEELAPEEYQRQLDTLIGEYSQLQERMEAIQKVNREGGKFIRDARAYDNNLEMFLESIVDIHGPATRALFLRQTPQPKNGAEQEEEDRRRAEEEEKRRAFEAARKKALEEADRLRREREEAEKARKAREEADRLRKLKEAEEEAERKRREEEERRRREEEERKRREAEDAERRRRQEEADRRRRQEEEDERKRREQDEADRRRRQQEDEAERKRREEEEKRRRDAERKRQEDEDRRRKEEAERRRRQEEEDEERRRREAEKPKIPVINVNQAFSMHQGSNEDEMDEFENVKDLPDRAKITEHEDESNMYQEETLVKTQYYEMEGKLNKKSSEILSFVEELRQGLLDLHSTGSDYFDLKSGSKFSLEEAVTKGHIAGVFQDILNKEHGIFHPETRQSLTLLEAIKIGLYDPDTRQLKDIESGKVLSMIDWSMKKIVSNEKSSALIKTGILKIPPMSLSSAIEQGVLDVESGQFTFKFSGESLSLRDAIFNGYVEIMKPENLMIRITLSDALEHGFINGASGEFKDKNSDDKFTLRDACSKKMNILNMHVPEFINTSDLKRLPLNEALARNVINTRTGTFTDRSKNTDLTLYTAQDGGLIGKPLTLREIIQKQKLDTTNHFIDKGTNQRFTLLQAIEAHVIDPYVRHIVDPVEKEVISLSDALERGIITAEGKYCILNESKTITLMEAYHEDLLTKRARHTIFDVKGIMNTETGSMVNFNEAVQLGIMIPQAERIIDIVSKESVSVKEADQRGLIDTVLQELLLTPIGVKDASGVEMNVIRAVAKEIIDPIQGVFIDKPRQRELSVGEAYQDGLIHLRGAMKLTAFLDISPNFITSVKKIDASRRISRPGQHQVLREGQIKITLAQAMKDGLIDSRTQRFRQGDIDVSLDEALIQGLLSTDSEWIVPARSEGAGPTIEEKVDESMTETAQQLAPKVYPDRNVEESVTTVKRVKRTETSALGGPGGGVSLYRAVTGGKGAVEVPAKGYHFREAERKGFLNSATGIVIPPTTDKELTLEDAINIGFLDGDSITFTDPKSRRTLTATEAIDLKVMDKTGAVTHAGSKLTLQQAIEKNIVHVSHEPPATITAHGGKKVIQFATGNGAVVSFKQIGVPVIEETETSWTFDSASGELVDLSTNERLDLDRALATGKLTYEEMRVRDTQSGREMSFVEAESWGIVNAQSSYYLDKTTGSRLSFTEAARQHKMYPSGGNVENAGDAIHTTVKVQTRSEVSKKEAVSAGPNQFAGHTIGKLVASGNFDPITGRFNDPDTNQQSTLKSLIMKGILNPYNTRVVDKREGRELSLLDAIQENLVDDINGSVVDTTTQKTLDFKSAISQGLVIDNSAKDSFEDSLVSGRLSMTTGFYTSPEGSKMHVAEAIKKQLLDGNSLLVKDPATGHSMTYSEGVTKKMIDPSTGYITNTRTEEKTSLQEAMTTGGVSAAGSKPVSSYSTPKQNAQRLVEQRLQFTPEISETSGAVALRETPSHKVVDFGDGKQVTVKVVRGEDGVEKGEYFDEKSGMKFTVQLNNDPFVTETKTTVKSTAQVQSVDLQPYAEFVGVDRIRDKRSNRIMSLADAERLGLAHVDKKGKKTTKTYTAIRSNYVNAINKGVFDSNGDKISLQDAICAGIIDIQKLTYQTPKSGVLSLSQAANSGLIDITLSEILSKGVNNPANGERISVLKAIEVGIIDKRNGTVKNPFTQQKLTWIDIVKDVFTSLTSEGIYDPTKGYGIPIASALVEGLIDTTSKKYVNTISGEKMSLDDAKNAGLIDSASYKALTEPFITSYKTKANISLIDAVDEGIFDPRNRTVSLNEFTVTPIGDAVNQGHISREMGEMLNRNQKMSFADALGKGIIDVVHDTFTDPSNGVKMTIASAVAKGYIDAVEKIDKPDEKNLAVVVYSDEFDEKSGRIRDRETGLNLTFKDAVHRGIIDPDSLIHDVDKSQTMTILEALKEKIVDSDGKFTDHSSGRKYLLSEGVTYGLLALIRSPMEAAQAVTEAVKKRESEGYKFKIETLPDTQRLSGNGGPKWRGSETSVKLTPTRLEPGMSQKMRQSIPEDIRGSRAQSMIEDPQAYADLQYNFLESLRKSQLDVEEPILQNPATSQRISIREAAESGLLDVQTGQIVHPKTGRRYSIPQAIHMGILRSEPGEMIMRHLNESLDGLTNPKQTTETSNVNDEDGTGSSWTRTVKWSGNPADLRTEHPNIQTSYTVHRSSSHFDSNQ
uniref:Calponin-homology (CH) domain-containing protein n=1 Tax=Rhabditophanes sp. KR3021 TaxID=114890 RepID=A0AC35UDU8_9BILA